MVTYYYQQVWFEGDDHQIEFSYAVNDQEEMPGLQLLEVDGMSQYDTPSRLWEFCESQMDPKVALTEEEAYRW